MTEHEDYVYIHVHVHAIQQMNMYAAPVFSSGVIKSAVGLCVVEEYVKTGLKTVECPLLGGRE